MNTDRFDLKGAKTAFICIGGIGTSCRFYAYRLIEGKYKLCFETVGYIGRGGICPPEEKFEGDGKTPEGVYTIGECFGNTTPPCKMNVPYTLIDEDDYWDGDSTSNTYNQHVKGSEKGEEWLSKGEYEHLIKYRSSYKYAAMINYNVSPSVAGKGSAIFLHVPSPNSTSSAGCVVIPEEYMIKALEMMACNTVIAIAKGET